MPEGRMAFSWMRSVSEMRNGTESCTAYAGHRRFFVKEGGTVRMADMREEGGGGEAALVSGRDRTGRSGKKKGPRPKARPLFVSGLSDSYMKNRNVIRAKSGQRMPTDQAM